jgi:hypothetical protein
MKKKKWGKLKLKLNSQPTQYWKTKFNKDNLKKNVGKHCSQTKTM